MLNLTHHAQTRLQQRGIPPIVVERLLDFGREEHDHRGSRIVYFDRRSRSRLQKAVGGDTYRRIERHLDAYAVLGERDEVITVGHRTHRINHH
jgi:hypothetical protein